MYADRRVETVSLHDLVLEKEGEEEGRGEIAPHLELLPHCLLPLLLPTVPGEHSAADDDAPQGQILQELF